MTHVPQTPEARPKNKNNSLSLKGFLFAIALCISTLLPLESVHAGFFSSISHAFRHAAHTVAHVAKDAGTGIKKAAEATGDGLHHAVKKTGDGLKTAAEKTADGIEHAAKKTGDGLHHAVKKTGDGLKTAAEKTADGITHAAKETGKGLKTAAYATGDAAKHAAYAVRDGVEYAANKTLDGLKIAAKESYKGLKTAANETVHAMIVAGHSIEEAAKVTERTFKHIDSDLRKITGGLGIVDILGMVFPEVATLNALIGVIKNPTDWHHWAELAVSPVGGQVLSAGIGKTAFKLARAAVRGGLIDNTINMIKHPNLDNLGKLAASVGTTAAAHDWGSKIQKEASTFDKVVQTAKMGKDLYDTGKATYHQGKDLVTAIKNKDVLGGIHAALAVEKTLTDSEALGGAASKTLGRSKFLNKAYGGMHTASEKGREAYRFADTMKSKAQETHAALKRGDIHGAVRSASEGAAMAKSAAGGKNAPGVGLSLHKGPGHPSRPLGSSGQSIPKRHVPILHTTAQKSPDQDHHTVPLSIHPKPAPKTFVFDESREDKKSDLHKKSDVSVVQDKDESMAVSVVRSMAELSGNKVLLRKVKKLHKSHGHSKGNPGISFWVVREWLRKKHFPHISREESKNAKSTVYQLAIKVFKGIASAGHNKKVLEALAKGQNLDWHKQVRFKDVKAWLADPSAAQSILGFNPV